MPNTWQSDAIRLSEGNPGACTVLGMLHGVDADHIYTKLDLWDIRGSAIWVLYKDVCGGDIDVLVVAMMTDPERTSARVRLEMRGH